jgi:hypothetical protein
MTPTDQNNLDALEGYLQAGGTVPVSRVSVAKVRGAARAYPYWYAAVYELRWSNRLKRPVLKFVAAASKAMADTCDAGTIGHVFELQPTRATLLDLASAFVGRV